MIYGSEGGVAALGGGLVLTEPSGRRGWSGAALLLAAMLLAQWRFKPTTAA